MLDPEKLHANVALVGMWMGTGGTSLELLEPDREAVCVSAEPLSLFPWLLVQCVGLRLRSLTGSSAPELIAITPLCF